MCDITKDSELYKINLKTNFNIYKYFEKLYKFVHKKLE